MTIIQQSLFPLDDFKDKRPLPLIVASKWGFPLQHHVEGETHWYALQDWVRGMIGLDDKNFRKYVNDIRNHVSLSELHMVYTDAKRRKVQRAFVQDEDLYQAAAYLRSTSERETLQQIKRYLAKAGAFVDKARIDPAWAKARIDGKVARSAFMAALVQAVSTMPPWLPGRATNDVYEGLFERTYAVLCEQLHTDSPRDKMTFPALQYLGIAEWIAAQHLGQVTEVSPDDARTIIQHIAKFIGMQVQETEQQLGVDVVTGKHLPSAVDAIRGADFTPDNWQDRHGRNEL